MASGGSSSSGGGGGGLHYGYGRRPYKSGQLVMIRHGTSVFNKNNVFTGWLDPQVWMAGLWCGHGARGSETSVAPDRRATRL